MIRHSRAGLGAGLSRLQRIGQVIGEAWMRHGPSGPSHSLARRGSAGPRLVLVRRSLDLRSTALGVLWVCSSPAIEARALNRRLDRTLPSHRPISMFLFAQHRGPYCHSHSSTAPVGRLSRANSYSINPRIASCEVTPSISTYRRTTHRCTIRPESSGPSATYSTRALTCHAAAKQLRAALQLISF